MRRWRRAGALMCLAATVAACSSGDADRVAVADDVPVATPSPLVALPTVDTTPPTAATTSAAEPATSSQIATSTTIPETIELGVWDWGVPCRVPVRQRLGPDNLAPDRTFDIVVTTSGDGFLLEFENVEASKGSLSDEQVAQYLDDAAAALPSIKLDADGRFVEFVDLEGALAELATSAGRTLTSEEAPTHADLVEPLVRLQTFGSWFGLWMDRSDLRIVGEPATEQRSILGMDSRGEVTVSAALVTSDPQIAQFGEDAARFSYTERGSDLAFADGSSVAFDVDADAIIGVTEARPFESTVWMTLFDTSDGRRTEPYFDNVFRYVFQSWFDWANAEGCA